MSFLVQSKVKNKSITLKHLKASSPTGNLKYEHWKSHKYEKSRKI